MAKSEQKVSGKVLDWTLAQRLFQYVRPYRSIFLLALFLTVMLAVLGPLRPVLIQLTLDNYIIAGDLSGLQMMIMIIVGTIVLETFIMYGNTYLTNWLGQSIIKDIRKQVFKHVLRLELRFFDKTPIGTLQTRVINDVETLNDVFTSGLVRIIGQLLQLFAIVGYMFYVSWDLSLAVLTTLPLLIVATIIFKNKVKAAFQQVRKSVSE
ncbi:MAG: ABC transporter ATP-binding protein, partial [Bacteroidota bacterium]